MKIRKNPSRGTSGFDNSGRGYYFANRLGGRPPYEGAQGQGAPHDYDRRPPPPYDDRDRPPYNSQDSQYPPQNRPYPPQNSQHNNHYPSHNTPPIQPEFYQGRPATVPGTSHNTQKVSSSTIGVDGAGAHDDRRSQNKPNNSHSSNNSNSSNQSNDNSSSNKDLEDKDKER